MLLIVIFHLYFRTKDKMAAKHLNGISGQEKVALLDAGAQYGKVGLLALFKILKYIIKVSLVV